MRVSSGRDGLTNNHRQHGNKPIAKPSPREILARVFSEILFIICPKALVISTCRRDSASLPTS